MSFSKLGSKSNSEIRRQVMKYAKILFRFLLIALVVTLAVAGLGRTSSRVVDASFQPDSPKDSGEGVTDQIIIKYKATANMRGVHAAASPVRMSQLSAVAGSITQKCW
jgi:hypothetical protein